MSQHQPQDSSLFLDNQPQDAAPQFSEVSTPEPAFEPAGLPAEYGLPLDCGLREKVRWEKQERFLKAYARTGTLCGADKETGIHWSTRAYWISTNMWGFRDRLKAAQEEYTAYWESHMDQRLESPQGNRGSDILLMFKLKALAPEKYRESVNINDTSGIISVLKGLQQLGNLNRSSFGKSHDDGSRGADPGVAVPSVDAQVKELSAKDASETAALHATD